MTTHEAAEGCRTLGIETSYAVAASVALLLEVVSFGAGPPSHASRSLLVDGIRGVQIMECRLGKLVSIRQPVELPIIPPVTWHALPEDPWSSILGTVSRSSRKSDCSSPATATTCRSGDLSQASCHL